MQFFSPREETWKWRREEEEEDDGIWEEGGLRERVIRILNTRARVLSFSEGGN